MEVLRRTLVMDVSGFVRLLKHPAMNGADCWYSAPAEYEVLRPHMFAKHSEAPSFLNGLVPDKFSANAAVISGCTAHPPWIVQAVIEHGAQVIRAPISTEEL
jgi:hypothetical protein